MDSVLQRVSLGTGCTRLVSEPAALVRKQLEQLTSFPLLGEPKPRLSQVYPTESDR